MSNRIGLTFIWHMHQPYYRDAETGKFLLPWVRLHATKGYWDMVQVLKEVPGARAVFNFTPVLLLQIEELNRDISADYFWNLSQKPAADLTDEERVFILGNFFMGNWETLIRPLSRYYQLLEKRGFNAQPKMLRDLAAHFSDQEMRDLQVYFNLIWCGFILRERDEVVRSLFEKGGGYTEEEKKALLEKQRFVLLNLVNEYKQLAQTGQIELTTTPFYHPILPLLYKADDHQGIGVEADARTQLRDAALFHEKYFGQKPKGLWPSEGSVSSFILPPVADAGFTWLATDEGMLYKSFGRQMAREDIYYPYLLDANEKRKLTIIFRDRELADNVGFVYSRTHPRDAVRDFTGKLNNIAQALRNKPGKGLVSVILDGENPWESYPDGGAEFLRQLYRTLSKSPDFEMVRVSDFLEKHPAEKKLNRLASGSWINSNFDIWGKGEEEEKAWQILAAVRKDLAEDAPAEAKQAMYAAEGSDWFWWYGDDFFSVSKDIFDRLFRSNLIAVYKRQGKEPPPYLSVPIARAQRALLSEPTAFLSPTLDGKITDYYEWKGAACYIPGGFGGSMFEGSSLIRKICYGFDTDHLYLLFDWDRESNEFKDPTAVILCKFSLQGELSLEISVAKKSVYLYRKNKGLDIQREEIKMQKIGQVAEIKVEFRSLGVKPGDRVEFLAEVRKGQLVMERWPKDRFFKFTAPRESFPFEQWVV